MIRKAENIAKQKKENEEKAAKNIEAYQIKSISIDDIIGYNNNNIEKLSKKASNHLVERLSKPKFQSQVTPIFENDFK